MELDIADKTELLKDIIAGTVDADTAKYIRSIIDKENCYQFFQVENHDETALISGERERYELYNKMPDKYKKMFPAVIIDAQDNGLGMAI